MFRSAGSRRLAPSFIGAGLKIEGDVSSEGAVDIAGSVKGNFSAQELTLCPEGVLEGAAKAERATINGALKGRLSASDVVLGSMAKVAADITYVSLRIDAGAEFVGQSRRVESLEPIPLDHSLVPLPLARPLLGGGARLALALLVLVLAGAPFALPVIGQLSCGGESATLCSALRLLPGSR